MDVEFQNGFFSSKNRSVVTFPRFIQIFCLIGHIVRPLIIRRRTEKLHGSAKRARCNENGFSTNRSNEQRPFGHSKKKTQNEQRPSLPVATVLVATKNCHRSSDKPKRPSLPVATVLVATKNCHRSSDKPKRPFGLFVATLRCNGGTSGS